MATCKMHNIHLLSMSMCMCSPIFHIVVLYIDKDESVRRQLRRGKLAQQHNDIVMATGVGTLKTVRETDLDPVSGNTWDGSCMS